MTVAASAVVSRAHVNLRRSVLVGLPSGRQLTVGATFLLTPALQVRSRLDSLFSDQIGRELFNCR